jgi:type II secretory pathway component PulK
MLSPKLTTHTFKPSARPQRQGSMLLLVLVVVAMLALGTSTFSLMMQNEHHATRQMGRQQQALRLAESGVAFLRAFLALGDEQLLQQSGLWNNPETLQGVLILDDPLPAFRGRFTILAPASDTGHEADIRYGLENESAKLNLNTLLSTQPDRPNSQPQGDSTDSIESSPTASGNSARERLLALPGMDVNLADAILDYLDADDLPREYGAEQAYYQQLDPPYQPINGPLAHLDQLLEIRGITSALLYGIDTNRNFLVDPNEGTQADGIDSADSSLQRGWSAYLTVVSGERMLTPGDEARIDINSTSLQDLSTKLSSHLDAGQVNFILALRQYGPQQGGQEKSPSSGNQAPASLAPKGQTSNPQSATDKSNTTSQTVTAEQITIDFNKKPTYQLKTLWDLVGVNVEIPGSENRASQLLESPWPDSPNTYQNNWPDLADQIQIGKEKHKTGRINILTAPRAVLQTLAPLSDSAIESVLRLRESEIDLAASPQRHTSWLLARDLVTLEEMKKLAPQITCRGDVYCGQVVGYFDSGRPMARIMITLDRIDPMPRLIDWQDLSSLGPGFSAELLGIEETDPP